MDDPLGGSPNPEEPAPDGQDEPEPEPEDQENDPMDGSVGAVDPEGPEETLPDETEVVTENYTGEIIKTDTLCYVFVFFLLFVAFKCLRKRN